MKCKFQLINFFLPIIFLISVSLLQAKTSTVQNAYNVMNFGAKADSKTMDTQAIQKTIDACAESGGGTVLSCRKYSSEKPYNALSR